MQAFRRSSWSFLTKASEGAFLSFARQGGGARAQGASLFSVSRTHKRGISMKNVQKGFTLIELMIVVAIIAILAAIAIPQYQNYIIRTQVSEGLNLADGAKTAVSEFYNNKGHFPRVGASAGLPAVDASTGGKYVKTTLVANGVITAKFANAANGKEANDKINDSVVALSPFDNGGTITWNCKHTSKAAKPTDVQEQFLPQACR